MSGEFTISVRAEALLAKLKGGPDRLHANLLRVVNRLSIEVQASVKSNKLTGQVLHVRTGTLRRSINRVITDDSQGVMASIGTNVRYAAIHEYGFEGTVNVREHTRKTKSGAVSNVRAHAREVNMPARSFLRSTLNDFKDRINQQIRAAALEAIQ